MKIAYIAHPVSGDVQGNISKIIAIVRQINLSEPDVVPFAPYIADLLALDDSVEVERERGIKNDVHPLGAGFVTELRLYGGRVSKGMQHEKELAESLGIPVIQF